MTGPEGQSKERQTSRASRIIARVAAGAVLFAGGVGAGVWYEQREDEKAELRAEAGVRRLNLRWQPAQLSVFEGTTIRLVNKTEYQGESTDKPCSRVQVIGMPTALLDDQLKGRQLGVARWVDDKGGASGDAAAEVGLIGSPTVLEADERLALQNETPTYPDRGVVSLRALGVLSCRPETVSFVGIGPNGEPHSLQGLESIGWTTLVDLGSLGRVSRTPVV